MRLNKASEIKKARNYLFLDGDEPKQASVQPIIHVYRNAEYQTEGMPFPAMPKFGYETLPLQFIKGTLVDIEICFIINKQVYSVMANGIDLKESKQEPLKLDDVFMMAISQSGKDDHSPKEKPVREPRATKKKEVNNSPEDWGYVSHQYSNQKAPSIYRVIKDGNSYKVEKQTANGWDSKNPNSKRMSPIIKKYKEGHFEKSL